MRSFRFTLQPVRDLREDRQTAAMTVLAGRIRAHQAAERATAAARDRRRRADAAIHGGTTAGAMAQAQRDRDAALVQAEGAALALADAAFGVTAARDDLVEAQRAVEVLAKLEARQRAAFKLARDRAQERELADLIEMRSARHANGARRLQAAR